MTNKKTIITFIIAAVILLIAVLMLLYFNSNSYYSAKLVSAIEAENLTDVQAIIDKKPDCINTLPTVMPSWWFDIFELRIHYPLVEACLAGNLQAVKLLVENGADVNCNDGFTPLSAAFTYKQGDWYEISLVLIESGASLNYYTEFDSTHITVLENIINSAAGYADPEQLLASFTYALENCDLSKVDLQNVLNNAITNKRLEIVRILLEKGYCNVNTTSITSPLILSVRYSTSEIVSLLLDYGADKSFKDSTGKTAYDYAVEENKTEIIEILLR